MSKLYCQTIFAKPVWIGLDGAWDPVSRDTFPYPTVNSEVHAHTYLALDQNAITNRGVLRREGAESFELQSRQLTISLIH